MTHNYNNKKGISYKFIILGSFQTYYCQVNVFMLGDTISNICLGNAIHPIILLPHMMSSCHYLSLKYWQYSTHLHQQVPLDMLHQCHIVDAHPRVLPLHVMVCIFIS